MKPTWKAQTADDTMDQPNIAPLALHGWYVLHQFYNVAPGGAGPDSASALSELLSGWRELGDDGWSGLYRLVGGGSDYMMVHFRSTLDELGEVERTLRSHPGTRDLILTGDYVSVVELGLYHVTAALIKEAEDKGIALRSSEWNDMADAAMATELEKRYVQSRLKPTQSEDMPYVCFYPMDKKRTPGQNWYTLGVEERAALMMDHGATGRLYAGRVSQIISGSVGLDDWEWAVTLFAGDPLVFKDLVTEMRYDEASAVYAEFGSFWVGHRIPSADVAEELAGDPA